MTKNEKSDLISKLTEEFKNSEAVVVCDYKGLGVRAIENLRIKAKQSNIKVQVIKNTLANVAMKNANIENLILKDSNIFIWGNDQLEVSKIVVAYGKTTDKFKIKSAYMDGAVVAADKVEALSKLPSRDELIAMLLQVWNAPITNFTIGLDALRAKNEESA